MVQSLTPAPGEPGTLIAENSMLVALGPFGSWRVAVRGTWEDNGGGICANVRTLYCGIAVPCVWLVQVSVCSACLTC